MALGSAECGQKGSSRKIVKAMAAVRGARIRNSKGRPKAAPSTAEFLCAVGQVCVALADRIRRPADPDLTGLGGNANGDRAGDDEPVGRESTASCPPSGRLLYTIHSPVTPRLVSKEHYAELAGHGIKALIWKRQSQRIGLSPLNLAIMR
jgi:hypothetical protein